MKIIHISHIDNDQCKGTSVVIPEHINNEASSNNQVAYLNFGEEIKAIKKGNNIKILKSPKDIFVFKPDIVIFHEVYYPQYITIYKKLKKEKIPYIVIPHGCLTIQAQNHKKIKKILGNLILFKKFINSANYIRFLSEQEKKNTKIVKTRSYILGNGVNIEKENLYLKKRGKDNAEKLNLIYIGRINFYHKGLDLLLDSLIFIKQKYPEFSKRIFLDIYGTNEGNCISQINRLIQRNNLNNIKVHGPITGKNKIDTLINTDCFIQTSRFEGQPMSIIEAMSLGMPIIATDGTGLAGIIKKHSCGIPVQKNKTTIVKAILTLLKNKKELSIYSENSYETAIKYFSWQKITEKTFDLYKEIIFRGDI